MTELPGQRAPQSIIESLLLVLRRRGPAALDEIDIQNHIAELSEQQVQEVISRLKTRTILRPWRDADLKTLVTLWKRRAMRDRRALFTAYRRDNVARAPFVRIIRERDGGWLVLNHRGHGWVHSDWRSALADKQWLDDQWRRRRA